MEINPNFLAPCGLYCGVCGIYYATRDENEKFKNSLATMISRQKVFNVMGVFPIMYSGFVKSVR